MSEWRETTLAEVSERVDYGFTASAVDDLELPRLLRITDIVGSHIDWASVPGCVVDSAKFEKFSLRRGDIVVARTGATVGHAKRIREHPAVVFASYLVRFRPSPLVDPAFVGAVVESQVFKDWVLQHAGGAAQPNANAKILGAFPFLLPDRVVQERVGQILSFLDDLIENNRRRIELLEQMAQAIHREWFVKFRYPGHEDATFVDSPLGPIPEGWKVGQVEELLVLQRGFDLPSAMRLPGDIPIIAASGQNGTHAVAKASGPGVATGRSGTVGIVTYVRDEYWPLNTVLWVKEFKLATPLYAYFLLESLDLAKLAAGAAVPTLNRNHVHCLPVVKPPASLIDHWDRKVAAVMASSGLLSDQNFGLCTIRDLLLPKLVTGQIDVSSLELDALVGSVA